MSDNNNISSKDKDENLIYDIKNGVESEEELNKIFKDLIEIKTERNEIVYIDKKNIFRKERAQKDSSLLYRCKNINFFYNYVNQEM